MAIQQMRVIDSLELLHHTIDENGMHIYFNVVESHMIDVEVPDDGPPPPLIFPPYSVRRDLHDVKSYQCESDGDDGGSSDS